MHNDVTNATRPEFCTEIAQLVRGHLAPGIMQKKIGQFHEKDIALALTQLTREECQNLFRILSAEDIANTLEYTDNPAFYFDMLGIRQKTEVLSLVEVSTKPSKRNQALFAGSGSLRCSGGNSTSQFL